MLDYDWKISASDIFHSILSIRIGCPTVGFRLLGEASLLSWALNGRRCRFAQIDFRLFVDDGEVIWDGPWQKS
jgi:hypothetical protein